MRPAPGVKITVTKNGPYFVDGPVPFTVESIVADQDGESHAWRIEHRLADRGSCGLCRCGQSENKPLCDGSHAAAGFDGTEVASREPYSEKADVADGARHDLADYRELCADARFCHRSGALWHRVHDDSDEAAEIVREECGLCPSGRYVAIDKATGEHLEPELKPSIALRRGPRRRCERAHLGARRNRGRLGGWRCVRGSQPGDAVPLRTEQEQAVLRREPRRVRVPRSPVARLECATAAAPSGVPLPCRAMGQQGYLAVDATSAWTAAYL